MRIAVVAPLVTPIAEPHLGGSQALLADIARGLSRRGHDVDVFAARGSSVDGVNVVDVGVDAGALADSLFRAGATQSDSEAMRDAFAKVYDTLDGYDIVHNHAFDAPAIELADGHVIHTLHLPPDERIARALQACDDATVACVSEFSASAWSPYVVVGAILRNGVPVEQIEWSTEPDDFVLYAGRLSPEKGVAEAVEIAKGAGVEITIAGGAYDEEYAQRFASMSVGSLAREDLWRLMARAAAVLCPVKWDEPFGLVAAEAQAAGTPVIGFRRGALPEVVDDGVTGALVTNVDEAVEALRDVERFDRTACRRHAEATLAIDATLDAHEELYRKVVAR